MEQFEVAEEFSSNLPDVVSAEGIEEISMEVEAARESEEQIFGSTPPAIANQGLTPAAVLDALNNNEDGDAWLFIELQRNKFCALGERSFALGAESGDCQLELLLDLGAGKRFKGLDYFAGGGIRSGNGHDECFLPNGVYEIAKSRRLILCLRARRWKASVVIPLYHCLHGASLFDEQDKS